MVFTKVPNEFYEYLGKRKSKIGTMGEFKFKVDCFEAEFLIEDEEPDAPKATQYIARIFKPTKLNNLGLQFEKFNKNRIPEIKCAAKSTGKIFLSGKDKEKEISKVIENIQNEKELRTEVIGQEIESEEDAREVAKQKRLQDKLAKEETKKRRDERVIVDQSQVNDTILKALKKASNYSLTREDVQALGFSKDKTNEALSKFANSEKIGGKTYHRLKAELRDKNKSS